MKTDTEQKLLHLLSTLLSEDKLHLISEITDADISFEQFRENCRLAELTPEERAIEDRRKELDRKFAGWRIYDHDAVRNLYTSRSPGGIDFKLEGLGIQQIRDYIQRGHLTKTQSFISAVGDHTPSENGLHAVFYLPLEKYDNLYPAGELYRDEDLDEWIQSKGYNPDFVTSPTIALNRHPDGTGIHMFFNEDDTYETLRIEGQPLHKAVSILLQMPDITEDELVRYLKSPEQLDEKLQQLKETNPESQSQMVQGNLALFVYEPGKLGYAEVSYRRKVTLHGEPLTQANLTKTLALADNGHVISSLNEIYNYGQLVTDSAVHENYRDFFLKGPMTKEPERILMNRDNDLCIKAERCINHDGKVFYMVNHGLRDDAYMKNYADITGRMTDIVLLSEPSPRIRCKIDGQQQMTQWLTYPQRLKLTCGFTTPQEEKDFLFQTAATLYKAQLLSTGPSQSKSRGI